MSAVRTVTVVFDSCAVMSLWAETGVVARVCAASAFGISMTTIATFFAQPEIDSTIFLEK